MPRRPPEEGTARPLIPPTPTLPALREAAACCRACPIGERATQVVFGEGLPQARMLFVGEQPGDKEDKEGRPFVGPAGRMFDRALVAAGIAREETYVTNVVKHFKWVAKGRMRLHQKPNAREIGACLPWLEAEIELIKPRVLVALGSTAAAALLGKDVRVTRDHGQLVPSTLAPLATMTIHPSSILRIPLEDAREFALAGLVEDLKAAARALGGPAPEPQLLVAAAPHERPTCAAPRQARAYELHAEAVTTREEPAPEAAPAPEATKEPAEAPAPAKAPAKKRAPRKKEP